MVKVIKNRYLRLFAFVAGLIFPAVVPGFAQNVPLLPADPAVQHVVMPDGLSCYVADNPYVKGFADYALVCRESGATLMSLKDVPTTDASVTDSTLIRIMYQVQSLMRPSGLAVIACGDLRTDEVLGKLKYMSFMIPSSDPVRQPEILRGQHTPVAFSVSGDTSKGLSTVRAQWSVPCAPAELLATTQPTVFDKTAHELGVVVTSRVRKDLRDKGVPVADVTFRHDGCMLADSVETFAFEVIVRDTSIADAENSLRSALASVDAYGASSSELILAEHVYMKHLENEIMKHDRTNKAYVQMCTRAYLKNGPLSASAQRLAYLRSKDISPKDRENIFANISSALVDLPAVDSISDSKVYYSASDTLAFPSVGPKVGMRLSRREHISGGVVWTFSNGFKVVYKKMPTSGVFYYNLALNGGYGDIKDLAEGEGGYVSDYLGLCNISGMKARDFLKVLQLSGITMSAQVNLSNVMISGQVRDADVGLLMKALLAVANERTPDQDAVAYHIECEKLRLLHAGPDVMGVTDSLMCPDYRYSTHKSVNDVPVDLVAKAESLLGRISSKMNDGVLVLVGDMYEQELRKAILPYVGAFRTMETAPRKTVVNYQPVSGSMTYNVDGDRDAIVMNFSARMPMTSENYMAAEVSVMALRYLLEQALKPYDVDIRLDCMRRIYPEDRLNIKLMVSVPGGGPMPQEVLTLIRRTVSGASGSELDANYIQAFKEYLKHMHAVQMQEPAYWLHAIAMRYLDGKDYTTGYASQIDAVSSEDIRKIFRLLDKGNSVEYIINRK